MRRKDANQKPNQRSSTAAARGTMSCASSLNFRTEESMAKQKNRGAVRDGSAVRTG